MEDALPAPSSPPLKPVQNPPKPKKAKKPNLAQQQRTALLTPRSGVFALPDPKPEYYEEDGLRKVKSYMYAFHSWAKERWCERTMIDVYGEFRDRSPEFYEWAIESGTILLNNSICTPSTIIHNGDLISNVCHRHEPPVVAGPIKILYDGRLEGNDGVTLVVEKPGSMPVHSTGRYHFNTLLSILKYDYSLPLVHTSNRLDRLTSGVMICALTSSKSQELGRDFGSGRVKKQYVARVLGKFPEGETICEEPLMCVDRQLGVNVVHPLGRDSKTIFTPLSYHPSSNTSVVSCHPITGRTHQIRVHLQWLGFPIANDPIYCSEKAWGHEMGKGGVYPLESSGGGGGGGEGEEEVGGVSEEVKKERWEQGERTRLGSEWSKERPATEWVPEGYQSVEKEGTKSAREERVLRAEEKKKKKKKEGVFNKIGHLKPTSSSSSKGEEGEEGEGEEEVVVISEECKKVLGVLREWKDEQDGWAKDRDVEGIELARKARDLKLEEGEGATSFTPISSTPSSSSIPASSTATSVEPTSSLPTSSTTPPSSSHPPSLLPTSSTPSSAPLSNSFSSPTSLLPPSSSSSLPTSLPPTSESKSNPDSIEFCQTCFVPMLKDPEPAQLFIWLHALRYSTDEWDYKSELPDWAREEWDGK